MKYSLRIVLLMSFVLVAASPLLIGTHSATASPDQARVSIAGSWVTQDWAPISGYNTGEYVGREVSSPRGPGGERIEEPPAAFLAAQQELEQNPDRVATRLALIEGEVERQNDEVEAYYQGEFSRGVGQARGDTQAVAAFANENNAKESFYTRSAFQEAYHLVLQEAVQTRGMTDPVINWTNHSELRPGSAIRIRGVNFGSVQGKVFMEVRAGYTVELEIWSWTSTEIRARMSPFVTALRPYSGALWVQTSTLRTSASIPCEFVPWTQIWWGKGNWIKKSGGLFGGTKDGTFLKGVSLGDPDFSVDKVERQHAGDGWSKFKSPYAQGQNLGQGYHIGVSAFGGARMRIHYYVRGPKDIAFPATPGKGPVGQGQVVWVLWRDEQPPSTDIVGGW